MRHLVRLGSFIGCMLATSLAAAAPTDFSAGSWIIPMDVCYQPSRSFNGSSFSLTPVTSSVYGLLCPDTSSSNPKDGILKAYGLIYRLLQNNIPVYYVLDSNKSAVDGTDLTITATTTPVALVNHATGALTEFMNGTHTSISYRGAPFIISVSDVPKAKALFNSDPNFTGTDPRTGRTWFQDVFIHQAKTNILQAPVRAILVQTPPKIALMDIGGAAIGVLQGYLKDAGLDSTTATAAYPTIGDVFTQFTKISDFTTSNGLVAGGFSILWAPHWEGNYTITASQRDAVIQKITAFVDAGNPFLAQCAAVATMEGANSMLSYGDEPASSYGHLITTATGSTTGLISDQLNQPNFPIGTDAIQVNPSATVKAWIDPLTQVGDFPLAINTQSWTFDFKPDTGSGIAYKPYVQSYVQSKNAGLQIETVAHKDGDTAKGLLIYLGGHSYGSQGSTCSGSCSTFNQYNFLGLERLVLNSLIFLGQIPTSSEQTRSAPIVYAGLVPAGLAGRTYLGSYVQQTSPSAAFPPWTGHFREYPAGGLSGANVSSFSSITTDWDSYNNVKTQASSDARNIYTAVRIAGKLTQIPFTTASLAQIQGAGGCTANNVTAANLTSIRTGLLGGIDHSIPAIIPPSTVAGVNTRPVVAYFGALDGMVHAILVSGAVGGKSVGDELWAFIPPSQLCKVFAQTAGVDGSPNVGDAFVDTTGTGTRSWRTIMAIPDGNYAGGTLDTFDITDSTTTTPKFLWEASDSFTSGGKTYVLGRAQGAAISPIMTTAGVQFAYFVATDNTTGTGGNGFNMYALEAGLGTVIWRSNRTYPNDTTHNDVPGTPAVIDALGDGGPITNVYFGDVEGKVWSLNAVNGTATQLYDAAVANGQTGSVNFPIESAVVLYRDPTTTHLDVLGVTGGADWVPTSTLSYVFKYDTKSNASTNVATLGAGERVYAVPTISGNQAYVITSIGQLQSAIGSAFTAAGNLLRINLGSTPGVTTLATVKQGASEVAVDGSGNVIAASATGITQNGNAGRDTSQGVQALQNAAASGSAKLLTVRAWLDWH